MVHTQSCVSKIHVQSDSCRYNELVSNVRYYSLIMRVSTCVHHLSFLEKGSLLFISLPSEEYIIIGGSFYLVPFV